MAKRPKEEKTEGEDYVFEVPDFDEDAFIHKEMVSFRTTTVLFFWGILAALVSWLVFGLLDTSRAGWYVGLVIAAVFGLGLRYVYAMLKMDISHFGRREWLGTAFLFFFTWLAFFILVINPPISDHASPHAAVFISPDVQTEGQLVRLDLFLEDNDRVDEFTFRITRGATVIATEANLTAAGDRYLYFASDLPAGTYDYTVSVHDPSGHEGVANGTFWVRRTALVVELPDDRNLDGFTDTVFVRPPSEVDLYAVYLRSGSEAIYLKKNPERGGWETHLNLAGWSEGDVSFDVVAQERNLFHGQNLIEGGRIVASDPAYKLTVSNVPPDPNKVEVKPQRTQAPDRFTPGPGLPLLVLGLLAAALVARRMR